VVILQIVAPGEFGGLERVVQALIRGLGRRGHAIHVAAVVDRGRREYPFLGRARASGAELHVVDVPARAYLRERAATAALCRRVRPDVVHTHGYRPDIVDAGAAQRCGVPVVTTVHGFTGGGWKNRLYEWLQRRALRQFDTVVAVSRPLADLLARGGVSPDRLALVPNAWEESDVGLTRTAARQALSIGDDRSLIGWVGRLSREKGADVFVEAQAHLTDLPVVASVIGDGPERVALRERATDLGLGTRLAWHGPVLDAGRLFRAFDVFVLSSRTEGTPMVLFEAMAAGVPIVAARVGGVPDVLSDAEALLIPPQDPIALARAIRAVLVDRSGARARAAAAQVRLARDFAPGPWLARYEAVYNRVARA